MGIKKAFVLKEKDKKRERTRNKRIFKVIKISGKNKIKSLKNIYKNKELEYNEITKPGKIPKKSIEAIQEEKT